LIFILFFGSFVVKKGTYAAFDLSAVSTTANQIPLALKHSDVIFLDYQEAETLLKEHGIKNANGDMKKLAKDFVFKQHIKDKTISKKNICIYNLLKI